MDAGPRREELLQRSLERSRRLLEHDQELQRLSPSDEALARFSGCRSSIACLSTACEVYAGRPCLAERAFEVVPGTGEVILPADRSVAGQVVVSGNAVTIQDVQAAPVSAACEHVERSPFTKGAACSGGRGVLWRRFATTVGSSPG